MPELPEVETVLRGLEPHLLGKKIVHALQRRKDLRWPLPPRFAQRLRDREIETMTRRGKYLLFGLDPARPTPKSEPVAETLLIHLGMSGRLLIQTDERANDPGGEFHHALGLSDKARKHDHVELHMSGGAQVIYNDARRFGAMDLIPTATLHDHKLIRKMGIEPLSDILTGAWLRNTFEGRRTSLKAALLDQRLIAGLGNIYVCEALFLSNLSPFREAGSLTAGEATKLAKAIKVTLSDAIASGGSSLRDFHGASGELGYFQHSFSVYDRADMPCKRRGCQGWVRRIAQNGRSTFSCGQCQL